ncbi:hypothetical protein HPP92_022882 [Vanilla planifolia]|uniref:Uncharacterized protein n=1 Tax=Vanilla planifolia TaxID=51239 RepID=A0A835PSB5_VANPL|nr:hypothetical protein HPP92_022882 [Vanilla planifolia]
MHPQQWPELTSFQWTPILEPEKPRSFYCSSAHCLVQEQLWVVVFVAPSAIGMARSMPWAVFAVSLLNGSICFGLLRICLTRLKEIVYFWRILPPQLHCRKKTSSLLRVSLLIRGKRHVAFSSGVLGGRNPLREQCLQLDQKVYWAQNHRSLREPPQLGIQEKEVFLYKAMQTSEE